MRRIFFLFIFLACYFYTTCQVIVNLQIPPEGLLIKAQLWNAILINTGNSSMTVKIDLSFTDLANEQQVFSASSATLILPPGPTNVKADNILPISYRVTNYNYSVDQSPDGFLPVGNFNICYQILKQNDDAFEAVAEECETVQVEPLSPPYLTSPDDQGEIEEVRPVFTWIPPAPSSFFSNLTYRYTLVEVLQGQSSLTAIQQNMPKLQQSNLSQTVLNFPTTSTALDTGKVYAWQVAANSNNVPAAYSEVWTFKIKSPQADLVDKKKSSFIKLMPEHTIPFTVCSDFLRYEYLNENNDTLVSFRITDITSKQLKVIADENISLRFGENYKEINLQSFNLKSRHYYLYQLTNSKSESWYVKFEYSAN